MAAQAHIIDQLAVILDQSPAHRALLLFLRPLILTASPDIRETVRWQVPFYFYRQEPFCYLNVVKAATREPAVDLAFLRGYELPDEAGRLVARGRKTVKSLVVTSTDDATDELVRVYLQEALIVAETATQPPAAFRKK